MGELGIQVYNARTPTKVAPDAPILSIGIPTRGTASFEFFISMLQMLMPLNVKLSYAIQPGKLPAKAREAIIQESLKRGVQYIFFLDDDVLFPDVTLYRLWVNIQRHPEAAAITGIVPTKLEPTEPMLYVDDESGAFWNWPLGTLIPIHSAGAGCMMVNLEYVRKLTPPYFDDVIKDEEIDSDQHVKRNTWGHDRYFLRRLTTEAGGLVYADTGLLLAHWDVEHRKSYILPEDSPCFQERVIGESYVPVLQNEGIVMWRRVVPVSDTDPRFIGYLKWINTLGDDQKGLDITMSGSPSQVIQ